MRAPPLSKTTPTDRVPIVLERKPFLQSSGRGAAAALGPHVDPPLTHAQAHTPKNT